MTQEAALSGILGFQQEIKFKIQNFQLILKVLNFTLILQYIHYHPKDQDDLFY